MELIATGARTEREAHGKRDVSTCEGPSTTWYDCPNPGILVCNIIKRPKSCKCSDRLDRIQNFAYFAEVKKSHPVEIQRKKRFFDIPTSSTKSGHILPLWTRPPIDDQADCVSHNTHVLLNSIFILNRCADMSHKIPRRFLCIIESEKY